MKRLITLFFALVFLAISASATVIINVRTTDNEPPYLYTWGGANNGEWPGTQMAAESTSTTDDGLVWFTQEFDADAINIIFNDGGDPAVQTANIKGVTGTAYYIFDPEDGEYQDVTATYVEVNEFDPSSLPEDVLYVWGEEFAYFVAPASWTACNVWAWNGTTGTHFSGSDWPGQAMTFVGNTTDGAPVFQWIGPDVNEADRPTGIIFNNGSAQTDDLDYVAGGVYDLTGKLLYTTPGGRIQLLEPVITENYLEFVGVNVEGNYKYTLNSYEWEEDHGPQLQIIVEPIDTLMPAYFSQEDLDDPNYWEPMFKRVTKQIAGQEMIAQNNIKRLYLGDVQLLENQFIDYENLHIIGFDLKKDYTLPTGCFLNAGHRIDSVDVKCEGTMTLSPNSLPPNEAYHVMVYTQEVYDVWNDYKQANGCQYILELYSPFVPSITAVQITANVDEEFITEQLPESGFEDVVIEEPILNFYLNRFEVDVNVDVDEIFMDYGIFKEGESPNGWTSIHATKTEDGKWVADNINLNILEGLEYGETYYLCFDFVSNYIEDIGDRLHYDNGGVMYRIKFVCGANAHITGDVNIDGSVNAADVTALYNYILNGDTTYFSTSDVNNDGAVNAGDVTAVYNIILGN